jgi:hypothetical protein
MLLSLIAASLSQSENLHILQAFAWEEVVSLATACTPDVLIYDRAGAAEGPILPLLFTNPRLLLIALDVETNRAVLLAGKETRSLTMEQVKEILLTC